MPDDPEAYMEKAKTVTQFADEWTAKMMQAEGALGDDGFPAYSVLYPIAIEHYVQASGGPELGPGDRRHVAEAAKHFETYWRVRGTFRQDEDGKPEWFTIYLQIQDHFRQWVNGAIKG